MKTHICVGLDPRFPDDILDFNQNVIDQTNDLVCAYKTNYAFYEAWGFPGLYALQHTIDYIHKTTTVPVILDVKWGDIGSTAEFGAQAAFEVWKADAVTISPYLGRDAILPFTAYEDKKVFLLCHTSNPSAPDLQQLFCHAWPHSRPLYMLVAQLAVEEGISLVMGATYPEAIRNVRQIAPDTQILMPGVGAQKGDLKAALSAARKNVIVSVSRSVIYAKKPRTAVQELRKRIDTL